MALSQAGYGSDPALANLELLRQRLREALYAKKTRLRELAELCKRQRAELRTWVKQRREHAVAELRAELRAARSAAQANRRSRLQEARRSSVSAVELARAAVEIERAHAADQHRITRAHETKRVAVDKAHARSLSENVMSASTLKRLAPLLEKAKGIRPAPGESRTEALWRYAHAHPEEMHALLEPATEKTIAQARKDIAAAEEAIRSGGAIPIRRAPSARKAPAPHAVPKRVGKSRRPTKVSKRVAKTPRPSTVSEGPAPRAATEAPVAPVAVHAEPEESTTVAATTAPSTESPALPAPTPAPAAPSAPRSRGPRRSRAQLGLSFTAPATTSAANDVAPAAIPTAPQPVAGPNPYEQKKAARIERQRKRAGKLRGEAEGAHERARAIGDMIPMGQPILVGHHSQRRHERDLGKIHTSMTKSVELTRAAETLERRADRAEKSHAVSSDDPEAVTKLKAKLEEAEKGRGRMRDANAAIRAGGDVAARLRGLGFGDKTVEELLKPDPMGRIGFPAYALQNASAESARIKARIAELERRATSPARTPETIGGATISEADNRVRVVFPCVPTEAVRKDLKGSGFHWSPKTGAWLRMTSNAAWYEAKRILTAYALPATSSSGA
jgi:hypothetical protein